MPTCKHKENLICLASVAENEKRVVCDLTDVCHQGVQTDCDDIFSEARFLADDSKVYYCTGLVFVKC